MQSKCLCMVSQPTSSFLLDCIIIPPKTEYYLAYLKVYTLISLSPVTKSFEKTNLLYLSSSLAKVFLICSMLSKHLLQIKT